jgi:hypothetical protein
MVLEVVVVLDAMLRISWDLFLAFVVDATPGLLSRILVESSELCDSVSIVSVWNLLILTLGGRNLGTDFDETA